MRSGEGKVRVAGVADAGKAGAGAVRVRGAGAEVEGAAGQHLQGTRAADLDVAGLRDGVKIRDVAGAVDRHAERRVGVGGNDVAAAGDEADVVWAHVLDVERDVGEIASGEDAGRGRSEKGQAGDVAGGGIKPQRLRIVPMERAGRMERLLRLQDPGGRTGFGKKGIHAGEEQRQLGGHRLGLGRGVPERGEDRGRSSGIGVGNIHGAGAPGGSEPVEVDDAVRLQRVDGAGGEQGKRAGGGGGEGDVAGEIDVSAVGDGIEGWRLQGGDGLEANDFVDPRLAEAEPRLGRARRCRCPRISLLAAHRKRRGSATPALCRNGVAAVRRVTVPPSDEAVTADCDP